jgi:hypothetical protein
LQQLRDLVEAHPDNLKIAKALVKALLTSIQVEDVSNDPKEKIAIVNEAEKIFKEKLQGKKDSLKSLGYLVQVKKGTVNLNFMEKEQL